MAVDAHESWWPVEGLGPHQAEPLPDPRRIDVVQAARLRDLFAHTGWSGEGADLAILRALFCARVTGGRIAVPHWAFAQDRDRVRRPVGPKRHYVTTSRIGPPRYTQSIDSAVRLLGVVLPQAGFLIVGPADDAPRAGLTWGDCAGRLHAARSVPLALMAALFDELAARPEAAAPRREPP